MHVTKQKNKQIEKIELERERVLNTICHHHMLFVEELPRPAIIKLRYKNHPDSINFNTLSNSQNIFHILTNIHSYFAFI